MSARQISLHLLPKIACSSFIFYFGYRPPNERVHEQNYLMPGKMLDSFRLQFVAASLCRGARAFLYPSTATQRRDYNHFA